MATIILDPSTHTTQRSEFRLASLGSVLPTIRLGGLGLWNPNANTQLNSASGLFSYIQSISMLVDGQTVAELRNAHWYLAYLASVGTADDGDSIAEPLSFSSQKLMPYMRRAVGAPGSTSVCARKYIMPTTAATVESAHFYLSKALPFLSALLAQGLALDGDVIIQVEYISDLQNCAPLSAGGLANESQFSRPYLIVDPAPVGVPSFRSAPSISYDSIESDMAVLPAVADTVASGFYSAQSRAFVGKSISKIVFCKTPQAVIANTSSGLDASFAQLNEALRVWVDGRQVTPLISNTALAASYGATVRSPVVLQTPLFELWQLQTDNGASQMIGSRHWINLPLSARCEQSLVVDYSRTGYSPAGAYPPGVQALNLFMFATVRKNLVNGTIMY